MHTYVAYRIEGFSCRNRAHIYEQNAYAPMWPSAFEDLYIISYCNSPYLLKT